MAEKFTRKELYDLVWSKPMKSLAADFDLSDVGLAKACKKSNIPRPPRGYWAKLASGKRVQKQSLPERGPGMSQELIIGRSKFGNYNSYSFNERILKSNPILPVFDKTIEEMRATVEGLIKKVTVPKFPDKAHRLIRKLLEADEKRRLKYETASYSSFLNEPYFNTSFEKRRLKILNTIFTALEVAGMKPYIQGKEARELSVKINDTNVDISLDAASQKHRHNNWRLSNPERSSDNLCFSIPGKSSSDVLWSIEDSDGGDKLEKHLRKIVVQIIIAGEEKYREQSHQQYEWSVKRKAELIERLRKEKQEDEEKERARIAALEKARIDKLVSDAGSMQTASYIRQYVRDVRARWEADEVDISSEDFENWSKWASEQADRIDPVRSGNFLKSIFGELPQDSLANED